MGTSIRIKSRKSKPASWERKLVKHVILEIEQRIKKEKGRMPDLITEKAVHQSYYATEALQNNFTMSRLKYVVKEILREQKEKEEKKNAAPKKRKVPAVIQVRLIL